MASRELAVYGCCAYLLLFALPIGWDISLLVLAVTALVAGADANWNVSSPAKYVIAGVMLVGATTLVSTIASSDIAQSAVGSMPMLPAMLLFWIVCYRLTIPDVRALLLSVLGLASLTSLLIIVAWWFDTSHNPHVWIRAVSRIIAVPNDTLILAVLSPVSVAMLVCERKMSGRVCAILTLLFSVVAIVLARSRLAMITIIIAQLVTLTTIRGPNLWSLLATAAVALAADAVTGFALLHKFVDVHSEFRLALWWAAGAMFLDAPFFGHGPNTFGGLRLSFLGSFPTTKSFGIDPGYVPWPHNIYLELLAERGTIALVGFGAALLAAIKAARELCGSSSDDARTAAASSFGVLVAVAFAGWGELSMLHVWVPVITYTFLGVVAMLVTSRRVQS